MKRLMRACAAAAACMGLSGAGVYTGSISAPERARIKTVGIVSAIGDTFMFERVRPSPFEWLGPPDASFLEISDWGLDDLAARTIAVALAKRFAIEPVTFERADFDTWSYDSLTRHILDLPLPATDVDAYILLLRDWRADHIGKSDHQIAGLGLYRRDLLSGKPVLGIFACYRIVVADAHTGEILASRAAQLSDGSLPWMPADPPLWPKTQNDLTDAQRKTLQADLTKLIDKTLPRALKEMQLAP